MAGPRTPSIEVLNTCQDFASISDNLQPSTPSAKPSIPSAALRSSLVMLARATGIIAGLNNLDKICQGLDAEQQEKVAKTKMADYIKTIHDAYGDLSTEAAAKQKFLAGGSFDDKS